MSSHDGTKDVVARQLGELSARWTAAFDRAPHGMALVDLAGRVLAANDALCDLLGRSQHDICGADFQSFAHADDRHIGLPESRRVMDGQIDHYQIEQRYLRADGETVWAQAAVTLIRDAETSPLYFLAHVYDVNARKAIESELAAYAARLHELASQDPLTGLRNYRAFRDRLEEMISSTGPEAEPFSVVLFDLDYFRDFNRRDRDQGDQLLEAVAHVLTGACRADDLCARVGSDEFALLLPGTPERAAGSIAARIGSQVDRLGLVSVSYGAATWRHGEDPSHLLLRADTNVQAIKRQRTHQRRSTVHSSAEFSDARLDHVRRLVSAARRAVDWNVLYLTHRTGDTERVLVVDSGGDALGLTEGDLAPGDEDARFSGPGAPVTLSDGRRFGTLKGLRTLSAVESHDVHADLLHSFAVVIAENIDVETSDAQRRRQREELAGMNALVSALSARDYYTGEHSKTVVRLAVAVAQRMGLEEKTVRQVEQVALLHDIGKVGIPDSILQKNGPLTEEEWRLMREHPAIGARVLAGTRTLGHLASAVLAEHERFDGTGYPNGLRGSAIPVASRVTLACDAYDAMTTDRPYRARLTSVQAELELRAGSGSQFDPAVVDALLAVLAADKLP